MKPIAQDVTAFLNRCSDIVAAYEHDSFSQNEFCYVQDNPVDSPIEQIFRHAFMTLTRINNLKEADPFWIGDAAYIDGVSLDAQVSIGKYRVDFKAVYGRIKEQGLNQIREVIVECDSQAFHERTERERRYEKERDRFLQVEGYKVFHFTGKEIKDNPFRVAAEVIAYLTGWKTEDIIDYDLIPEELTGK